VNALGNLHELRVNVRDPRGNVRCERDAAFTLRSCQFPMVCLASERSFGKEVRDAMVVSEALPTEAQLESSRVPTAVVMPSQRHSVLAKARRYREESDRLLLVTDNPLTVVINGFHANHTVVRTVRGFICSCERFRRGAGPCAHVLAVEQRFGTSNGSMTPAEVAEFVARALAPPKGDETSTRGLLEHVIVPVWDIVANGAALMVTRGLVRTVDGRLTLLNVDAADLTRESLVDTAETLDRLVTSSSWEGSSLSVAVRPEHALQGASLAMNATLVAVPLERAEQHALGFGRELVEQLHCLVRVPLLAVPSGSPPTGRLKTIVAAVDGSPSSLAVLAAATSLAQPLAARLVVLHVGPQPDRPAAGGWATAREWVDVTAERLRAMGISAVGRATLGHPIGAIESVASTENADIVVVGADVRSDRPRLTQRTQRLLRRSTRPLLLVRADASVAGTTGRHDQQY
jgi:nucleotide-binding universal stress UspA family protein